MPKRNRFQRELDRANKAAEDFLAALVRGHDVGDPQGRFADSAILVWGRLIDVEQAARRFLDAYESQEAVGEQVARKELRAALDGIDGVPESELAERAYQARKQQDNAPREPRWQCPGCGLSFVGDHECTDGVDTVEGGQPK